MQMYRIELSPGEETAFRSIEELAVAIRRGVITPHARIWHNASSKWLPIQFHPHYKVAASMQLTAADLVAGPPVKPLELLTLGEPMDPPAVPVRPVPVPTPRVETESLATPEPQPALSRTKRRKSAEPESKPRKQPVAKSRKRRSGHRPTRIALAGALLIGCAHLSYSAASAVFSDDLTTRRWIASPGVTPQGPETTAATVIPGLPRISRPGASHQRAQTAAIPDTSLESQSEAATPPLDAFHPEAEPIIQPAPPSAEIAAPVPTGSDSLARKLIDSTNKKQMKRILRTISGTPTAEQRARR
jgi:hypothetical protein